MREKPDIKKIRTSLWVMLTLLKGTSDATIDFACLQKFQHIQGNSEQGKPYRHMFTLFLLHEKYLPRITSKRMQVTCH